MTLSEFIYTVILRPPLLKRAANAVVLSMLPKTIRVGPATVHVNPTDPVMSGTLLFRIFERDELAYFTAHCRPDMTVVDVGANVGVYSALAMYHAGAGGRVIAIEPHAETRRYLAETMQANGGRDTATPHIFDCAASDHHGAGQLFPNPINKGDNRVYRPAGSAHKGPELIELRTIDAMLAQLSIAAVDLIKIDVQGYELAAIKGAARTIANSPNLILMSEFWPDGIRQAGADPNAYLDLLSDLGLKLYELKRGQLIPLASDLIARLPGRSYTNIVGMN